MDEPVRYLPAGDKALSIELADSIGPEIIGRVRNTLLAIEKHSIPGIIELVPSYRSILVYYDPLQISFLDLKYRLASVEEPPDAGTDKHYRSVHIPTRYGGEMGPDLDFVAQYNNLTTQEVVRIHSSVDYLVYMLGFSPGFPYLGGVSSKILTPRLETPRLVTPAGSVGIAENQTGIYPVATPGGWRIIGRTPLTLFDPLKDPPTLLEPGDFVRFIPINAEEYKLIESQLQQNIYQTVIESAN